MRLRQEQMNDLVTNLDNYISLGRITEEDAERLRKAHQVEQAVRSGKIDGEGQQDPQQPHFGAGS